MQNHGCHPFGNAKARAVVWNFPDPVPQHREPLYSNRPDLIAKYPTHDDKKAFWRLPTLYKTVQQKNVDIGARWRAVHTVFFVWMSMAWTRPYLPSLSGLGRSAQRTPVERLPRPPAATGSRSMHASTSGTNNTWVSGL
mgnify:CR=1 FL=1